MYKYNSKIQYYQIIYMVVLFYNIKKITIYDAAATTTITTNNNNNNYYNNNNNNNNNNSNNYVPINFNFNVTILQQNQTPWPPSIINYNNNNNDMQQLHLQLQKLKQQQKHQSVYAATVPSPLSSSVLQHQSDSGGVDTTSPYIITELAKKLEATLKNIRNLELGFPIVQELFDSMEFKTIIRNDTKTITAMIEKLKTKLNNSINIINHMIDTFMGNNMIKFRIHSPSQHLSLMQLHTIILPCQFDDGGGTSQDFDENNYDKNDIEILNYFNNSEEYIIKNLNLRKSYLFDIMKSIDYSQSNIKQIYFLSKDDNINCDYCENVNHQHLRYIYSATMKNKKIVLLIDHGSSLNTDQLELTKKFAIDIVRMLNENDQVILIGVSDKIIEYSDNSVIGNKKQMYNVTMDTKMKLIKFIRNLNKTKEITNHTLGFRQSFQSLYNYNNNNNNNNVNNLTETIINNNNNNRNKNNSNAVPVLMLYISRGLLSPLTEAKSVLEAIAQGQQSLKYPVIINTCAIILDEKRVMYEKQFLKDVAIQNYTKYNINVTEWLDKIPYNLSGKMFTVYRNYSDKSIKTSIAIFNYWFQENLFEENTIIHLPVVDDLTKDMIVSITKPFKSYGIFGVDMYLSDITEDIIYYNKQADSYSFLIDLNGNTIMHPSYPRPIAMQQEPFPTDIQYFEIYNDFVNVRHRMLNELMGNATIAADNVRPNNTITFTWERALNFYIICVATFHNNNTKMPLHLRSVNVNVHNYHYDEIEEIKINAIPDLLYHRIDLVPPKTNICRHFKQIATLESGTLYLSSSSFKSPFMYLKNNRDGTEELRIHYAKSIMAYLKDTTNLLANPGLMAQIRNDVAALFHVIRYLKGRHNEGGILNKYIIRRYVATVNGVIQVYPGCMLSSDIEPTRRPWFKKAMEHPGKIVLTEPYLDAGGAGYIVTISQTIFEGRANALHSAERDVPVAIVSIDLTHGFFFKLLLQSADFCSDENIKCFLIEDKGYLVSHPSILEPLTNTIKNYRRPIEHITHKESYVANDILYHKLFVQKKFCRNYLNRTNQRYYQFNTTFMDVLTNTVHSERTKYQITIIPGTNVFVGLLNTTCDGGAFCPCSTVDRICLNCNLMEQTNCECPCECPLDILKESSITVGGGGETNAHCNNVNTNNNNVTTQNNNGNIDTNNNNNNNNDNECIIQLSHLTDEICLPPSEHLTIINSLSYDLEMDLKSCININCELYTTQTDCLGIMGCEWCQVDLDGETIFTVPFCTQQISCFNGVLGSITPYGDGDLSASMVESIVPPAYSAIGPVAGAVIALCLVVGFAMYCYRQNLDSGNEHLYAESIPENNYGMPLSRLDYDDIGPNNDHDFGGNNMNHNLLGTMNNPIVVQEISPYRMNAGGYRRPNGESDHGYSTMTPHEDSDLCFALAEPLINNNHINNNNHNIENNNTNNNNQNKRLSMSDSLPISTSVSSPTNHNHLISFDKTPPPPIKHHSSIINDMLQHEQTTILPSPHHIQAPVTVHRTMEAS